MNGDISPLVRLEQMGFRKVGTWNLVDQKINCALTDQAAAQNILYAFILDGTVAYIGKTTQTLKRRMYGYQQPQNTQTTNIKGNRRILDALASDIRVDIYALPDNGLLFYGGYHLNLAAGLEDSLIRVIRPAWNIAGV